MLFSYICKSPEVASIDVNNEWVFYTNEDYDYSYIENTSIRQRIFQGKYARTDEIVVNDDDYLGDLYREFDVGDYQFINNGKNMGLSIMDFSKSKKKMDGRFDNVLFLTIPTNCYKLLRYNIYNKEEKDIIQTYKKVGSYQGCAIGFNHKEFGDTDFEDELLFDVELKNVVTNQYTIISFSYIDREYGMCVTYDITTNIPVNKLKELRSIENKYSNRMLHFKMTCNTNKFITNTYIVDDHLDKELMDTLCKRFNTEMSQNNYQLITVDKDSFDYLKNWSTENPEVPEKYKEVDKIMEAVFMEGRVRATTIIGLDVPKSFCNKYRILYLFKYDIEKDRTFCLRSN